MDLYCLLALQDLADKSLLPPERSDRLLEKTDPMLKQLELEFCKAGIPSSSASGYLLSIPLLTQLCDIQVGGGRWGGEEPCAAWTIISVRWIQLF